MWLNSVKREDGVKFQSKTKRKSNEDVVTSNLLGGFLILLSLSSANAEALDCCSVCDCKPNDEVWCEQRNLNTVPTKIPTSTRRLYLFHNNISAIPDGAFSELQDLELLDLSLNKLSNRAVKENVFQGLTNLKDLILSENLLSTISADTFAGIPNLVRLYLKHNHIATVHERALDNLTKLVELKLSFNRLTKEPKISNSPNLRRLCLSSNRLKQLRSGSLASLNLEELSISENHLNQLPAGVFGAVGNLRRLDISQNRIIDPPPIINNMTMLQTLNLSGNDIETLPGNFLEKLRRIRVLDLRGLQLTTLSKGFIPPRVYLNIFDISNNPWKCDCKILWLVDYMRMVNSAFSNIKQVQCNTPTRLQGRQLKRLTERDHYCEKIPTSSTTRSPMEANQISTTRKPAVDLCDAMACANGAECVINQTTHMPACRCPRGWKGLLCDKPATRIHPTSAYISISPPGTKKVPQLMVLYKTLTANSVNIRFPVIGKQLAVSTTVITAAGKEVRRKSKIIFPQKHSYAVTGLESGTKYNICITMTDTVEDKLCAVVTTHSVTTKGPAAIATVAVLKSNNKYDGTKIEQTDKNPDIAAEDKNDNKLNQSENSAVQDSKTGNPSYQLLLIITAVVLVTVLLAVGAYFIYRRRKKRSKHANNNHSNELPTLVPLNKRPGAEGETLMMSLQPNLQSTQSYTTVPHTYPNGDYYDVAMKHNCTSCIAPPHRVGTPNKTESLGRSSSSGGSASGNNQPYVEVRRCGSRSSSGHYPMQVEDARNRTPPNGYYNSSVPHSDMRQSLSSREQDAIYNSHGSPRSSPDSEFSGNTTFRESNSHVGIVQVLSNGATGNHYHHGPVTTTARTYPYQPNSPTTMAETGYHPMSLGRPQPVPMHYSPTKQLPVRYADTARLHLKDGFYNANPLIETQMKSSYPKTLAL